MDTSTKPNLIDRDVQLDVDTRGVHLQQVGICDLKVPLVISGIELDPVARQPVAATVRLTVDLAAELRGIHMSRLVEDLLAAGEVMRISSLFALVDQLRSSQGAGAGSAAVAFDYFLPREAPVSGRVAPQPYRCHWTVTVAGTSRELVQRVEIPVTTLCPCSKEISEYGAHNQRGYVEVALRHRFGAGATAVVGVCLEEMIEQVEAVASARLYPILKRVDERHVTMQAYESPAFVEDLARNVVLKLRGDDRFDAWQLTVTNHESIHQHNATARVQSADW